MRPAFQLRTQEAHRIAAGRGVLVHIVDAEHPLFEHRAVGMRIVAHVLVEHGLRAIVEAALDEHY